MGWLKNTGLFLAKMALASGGISTSLGGKVGQLISQGGDIFSKIVGHITSVETIFATLHDSNLKTGADKAKAVQPLILNEILSADFMLNKKIDDEVEFRAGVADLNNAVVRILNAIKEK